MEGEEKEKGRCLECGDILPYGRSDMKFCSSACKNRYNYQAHGHTKGLKRKILNALERNHAILEELLEAGVTSVEIPDLAQMGYNFDCVTSYHKVRSHNEYRCFDIKYYMSESRIFGLARTLPPAQKKRS